MIALRYYDISLEYSKRGIPEAWLPIMLASFRLRSRHKFRKSLQKFKSLKIAPRWVLVLVWSIGIGLSVLGLVIMLGQRPRDRPTITLPPSPSHLPSRRLQDGSSSTTEQPDPYIHNGLEDGEAQHDTTDN